MDSSPYYWIKFKKEVVDGTSIGRDLVKHLIPREGKFGQSTENRILK